MELTLQLNDALVLEVRFAGDLEAIPRVGTPGKTAPRAKTRDSDLPAELGLSPHEPPQKIVEEESSSRPARKITQAKPIRAASAPDPVAKKKPSQPAPDTAPPELGSLPRKHQEFYKRKLAEYQEIYPPKRAEELAVAALRKIIGPA